MEPPDQDKNGHPCEMPNKPTNDAGCIPLGIEEVKEDRHVGD
jgi:hypothetical protein